MKDLLIQSGEICYSCYSYIGVAVGHSRACVLCDSAVYKNIVIDSLFREAYAQDVGCVVGNFLNCHNCTKNECSHDDRTLTREKLKKNGRNSCRND